MVRGWYYPGGYSLLVSTGKIGGGQICARQFDNGRLP